MNFLPLQIRQGLHPSQLQRAAQLYFDTFRRQVGPILGTDTRAVAFLRQVINPQAVLTALRAGEIVGLAGLQYDSQRFIQPHLHLFTQHFGWLLGRIRFRQAALFEQPLQPGHLRIDSITVDPSMRGQGVGTWLINSVTDFASKRGFEAVQINIPDTAPALMSLCQRLGFVCTAAYNRQFLKPFGITSFTTLTKSV
jgi:GNAT superfamily N-acetyltransferase